jgi:hypothetical protein
MEKRLQLLGNGTDTVCSDTSGREFRVRASELDCRELLLTCVCLMLEEMFCRNLWISPIPEWLVGSAP